MLFSDPVVQQLVREEFHAAWQNVRPVPRVSIDFGSGFEQERTLHGNVATYVCDPSGYVVDVIPGLWDPVSFATQLREALDLLERSQGDDPGAAIERHHRERLAANDAALAPDTSANRSPRFDLSKVSVEGPLKRALGLSIVPHAGGPLGSDGVDEPSPADRLRLVEDTRQNLELRKPVIHRILGYPKGFLPGDGRRVRPAAITRVVYREALDLDLDDPYLGLAGGTFDGGGYEGEDVRRPGSR